MRSPFRKSQEYTFEPVFTPQEAIDKTIVWDCNDTSIVSIEQNGTITALAIGEVNITATSTFDSAIQASAIVIVDREIAQIVVGGSHSAILDTKGDVWVAGGNENGQLGIGNNDDNSSFVKAKYLKNVKSIAAGKTHTLALDDKGEVWVAGSNSIGQIGIGALEDRNNFSNIMNSVAFKAIAAGARHSLALDNEGNMWATGVSSRGQLGFGDNEPRYGFEKVPLPELAVCPEGKYLDEASGKRKQKVTRIYFFNGINTNRQESEAYRDDLRTFYEKQFEYKYKGEIFEFDISYNFSFGFIKDVVEVFAQKWAEKQGEEINISEAYSIMKRCVDEHWFKSDPACQDFAAMQEDLSEPLSSALFSLEQSEIALSKFNASIIIAKINEHLLESKRAIIVAHSQGNLFGNKAYSALIKEYPDQVGMIGVASPAGWDGGKNYYYVTAHDDIVIDLVRAANILTLKLFVGSVLPSNVDNNVLCNKYTRDFWNHAFVKSYMFSGVIQRGSEWWRGTKYEEEHLAVCPDSQTEVNLPSRKMVDKYFERLLNALRYSKPSAE